MHPNRKNTTKIRVRVRIVSPCSTEPLTQAIKYNSDRNSGTENFGWGELGQGHLREGLRSLRLQAVISQSAHLIHPVLQESGAHAGLLDDAALQRRAVVVWSKSHKNFGTFTARLDRLEVQGRWVRVIHHHLHHRQQRGGLDQIHLQIHT